MPLNGILTRNYISHIGKKKKEKEIAYNQRKYINIAGILPYCIKK
jgi:hypothetical protein